MLKLRLLLRLRPEATATEVTAEATGRPDVGPKCRAPGPT